ncbi:MAG: SpoIIIAC/SpoIIIAD family protein [Oscillospiraceae bacterium]
METLLKAAAVLIPAAVFASAIKKDSPALALLLAIAAGCVTLFAALDAVEEVTAFLEDVADTAGMSPTVLSAVMKTVGVALLTRLASDVCRDAGMNSAASSAELAGAAAALYVSIPVMRTVFQMIKGLL